MLVSLIITTWSSVDVASSILLESHTNAAPSHCNMCATAIHPSFRPSCQFDNVAMTQPHNLLDNKGMEGFLIRHLMYAISCFYNNLLAYRLYSLTFDKSPASMKAQIDMRG
jgi:hypothetical protein